MVTSMKFSRYVELQVTSNFSFLRGASHPEELVKTAASLDYQAIAITDLHTVSGVVRAFEAAKESSITLIVGTALDLLPSDTSFDKDDSSPTSQQSRLPFRLYLYPTSVASYGNMCAPLTAGKMRAPKGSCFLTLEDVAQHHEGLLAVVDFHSGVDVDAGLTQYLVILRDIFNNDRLSLLLCRNYRPREEEIIKRTVWLSKSQRVPLLAGNNVLYHEPERRKLQDILTCIRHGTTLEEAGFKLRANAERYLKSQKEMCRLFERYPQALERSLSIASQASNFSLKQLQYEYPKEICPDGRSPDDYLSEVTWLKAKERYPRDSGVPEKVQAQLEHELRLVRRLYRPIR